MYMFELCIFFVVFTISNINALTTYGNKAFDCGPYGFICERNSRVRLCEGNNLVGPAFLCPPNTVCNEDSSDVCDNALNYMDPGLTRGLRCHRNERIADQNVPGCKGYILCIPNRNRFQGIKFKCSGNTIFNGFTRTCSSPEKYRCPLGNTTKSTLELFEDQNRRIDTYRGNFRPTEPASNNVHRARPIECKNYKFTVTRNDSPGQATYFCPKQPVRGESGIRCTIFSNQFCITLEKDDEDQFILDNGAAYRKPRM